MSCQDNDNVQLIIYKDTTFIRNLQFKETTIDTLTGNISEAPIDITGYTFDLQARTSVSSTTIAFQFDTVGDKEGVITLTAPTEGKIEIKMTDTNTSNLTAGTYVYDLQWTDTSANVKRLMAGDIIVRESVTR